MKKQFLQSFFLQVIYKAVSQPFLKIIVGVKFENTKILNQQEQFIILANHNSHLDTISLLSSIPRKKLWQVKPVAADDYFGNTKIKKFLSNYFINTLLIQRKIDKEADNPIDKMLEAIDAGYSLIIFPEGTRSISGQMNSIKKGAARVLSARPHIQYIPVYLKGMQESLPKGEVILLPYKSSVQYGVPTHVISNDVNEIVDQIKSDFQAMEKDSMEE